MFFFCGTGIAFILDTAFLLGSTGGIVLAFFFLSGIAIAFMIFVNLRTLSGCSGGGIGLAGMSVGGIGNRHEVLL
jgi:hypothetical protein